MLHVIANLRLYFLGVRGRISVSWGSLNQLITFLLWIGGVLTCLNFIFYKMKTVKKIEVVKDKCDHKIYLSN